MTHVETAPRAVVLTGVSTLSAVGEDAGRVWDQARRGEPGPVDTASFAPFRVLPFGACPLDEEVPRAQARYMGESMRATVFAAGRALRAAGLKGSAEQLAEVHLLLAACEGERDVQLDKEIYAACQASEEPDETLNHKLAMELRPSLFLAQLPNLYAANVSIVHGVTGSSVTFIGEESAGMNALRVAHQRVRAGRARLALAGGGSTAQKLDMLMAFGAAGKLSGPDALCPGSAASFALLEEEGQARARGAKILARVLGFAQRGARRPDRDAEALLAPLLDELRPALRDAPIVVISGTGPSPLAAREQHFWMSALPSGSSWFNLAPVTGALLEACMPHSVAVAVAALSEREPGAQALVSVVGHENGESLMLLEKTDD